MLGEDTQDPWHLLDLLDLGYVAEIIELGTGANDRA
jgi:hypothetical protein